MCAALRSLTDERDIVTAALQREWELRTRDSTRCNLCGEARHACECKTPAEVRDELLHDDTWTSA